MRKIIAILAGTVIGGLAGGLWDQLLGVLFWALLYGPETAGHVLKLFSWKYHLPWMLERAATHFIPFALAINLAALFLRKTGLPIWLGFLASTAILTAAWIMWIILSETGGSLLAIWRVFTTNAPAHLFTGLVAWGIFAWLATSRPAKRQA